jgi:excisionase family DNA binding protein
LSIKRSTMYTKIKSGEIETVTIGRSRRVPAAALQAYVERLQAAAHVTAA